MANKIVKSDYLALKKFNQKTEKGDIFERDIMTINPLEDLFTPGQDIIYSDSNFKFSVRTDQDKTKKHTKNGWLKNADGEEVWNLTDVDSSPISEESEVVIKPNYSSIKDFAYYGSAVEMIRATVNHAIMYFPAELYFSEQTLNDYLGLVSSSETISDFGDYFVIPNDLEIDVKTDLIEESEVNNPYRYLCVYGGSYEVYNNSGETNHIGVTCVYTENKDYKCGDGVLGSAVITESGGTSFTISAYSYNNKEYLIYNDSSYTGYSVRPNNAIVNEYFATIDEFEKVLLNKETKPLYKAIFETPYETDEGNKYTLESYIWPSRNNWNPIVDGGGYEMYIGSLIKLASFHDEYDSNIIWRMLTHEAIKNLDWTFFRENGSDVEDLSKIDSSKIEAFLQLYGRQFDGLKRYIDSIKYTNNVTYDQKNNLPDYMLTDVVENSGFEAILPNATAKTDAMSDVLYPSRSIGSSEVDANTQFMRNLKINAPYINSLKGTRYGVETILKLCGLKDDEFKITEYVTVASGSSGQCKFSDDLSYGDNFYPRPSSDVKYPSAKDVISININKGDGTVDDMETYFDGIPVKPFRCVNKDLWCGDTPTYYAIPWYENGKHYDGGWYFQSKGGWDKRKCEKVDNSVVPSGVTKLCYDDLDESIIYDESESSLKYAETVSEMKGFFKTEIKDKMVCYVTNLENWDEYSADVSSHYFIYDESGDTWDNILLDEIRNANTYNGKKVIYLENIKESTKGNNPHIGNDEYDGGKEYLEYMNQIFKYSLDNNDFPRFSQNDIEKIEQYYKFNIGDFKEDNRKCDYFFNPNANSVLSAFTSAITISSDTYENASNPEGGETDEEPAANSIINVKNLRLEIKKEIVSGNTEINEKWQDYITNVVMNYVKQMLPSTVVFSLEFSGGTPEYYLKWADGTTTDKTINVAYSATSITEGIKTNVPELTISKSGIVSEVTTSDTSVNITFSENTGTTEHQGTVTVAYGGSALTVTVIQEGKPIPKYLYIESEGQTSVTYSVNSGGTSSKSYRIITNYEQSELDAMTKNKPDWVNNLSLTTSNVSFGVNAQAIGASSRSGDITFSGITISITQRKGEDFYMNVTTPSNILATATSFDISVVTNSSKQYTIYVNSTPYTSATGNFTTTYTCGENTGITQRTFTVSASNEDISSNTSTVTQNGISESVTLYLNGTNGNITIGSGVTSFTIKVVPSANAFSYNILVNGSTWKSGITGTSEYTYNCGANSEITARTFTVKAESTNASEEFTVTQESAEPYFKWSDTQTSATTATVESASTTTSKEFTTNMTGLTVSCGGCIETASITGDIVTANYTVNTGTTERYGDVMVMSGSTVVGTFGITQNAAAPQTRTIIVHGSQDYPQDTKWTVSNTKQIVNETDIHFVLTYDSGDNLEGDVVIYENPQTEIFLMGGGMDLTIETENTSAFNLTLTLRIEADGDRFKFTPNINPHGFESGTAGGGSSYESTGSIYVPAGSVGSTTDVYISKTTWDLTAP